MKESFSATNSIVSGRQWVSFSTKPIQAPNLKPTMQQIAIK